MFQRAHFRDFKHFYIWVREQYCSEFPKLPSYERFLILQQRCLPIITALMYCIFSKNSTPLYAYIDSTPIKVCHNKRIFNHKAFKNLAARGKSTMGWFYGFKLHIVVDLDGNILNACLTPGNCDDREPVEKILKYFQGVICGDRGYISQNLFKKLWEKGIKMVTGIKQNMKNKLMLLEEKILLKKRSLVESVFGSLKRKFMLEHTRHRSVINFLIHIASTLVAYQLNPQKPHASRAFSMN